MISIFPHHHPTTTEETSMKKTTTQKTTVQTTRLNGAKVRIVTTTSATGTSVKVKAAPLEEWILQASAVRALRAMPEHGAAPGGRFLLAGDFNAARRSMREQVKAKATGLTPGEHDLRLYMTGGRLGLIEYKNAEGKLAKAQITRHADLRSLGFSLQAVIKASTEAEAAERTVAQVREWLATTAEAA
ncbi:VRR-NUC domain-containing protein [Rhizobium leguminosarum]